MYSTWPQISRYFSPRNWTPSPGGVHTPSGHPINKLRIQRSHFTDSQFPEFTHIPFLLLSNFFHFQWRFPALPRSPSCSFSPSWLSSQPSLPLRKLQPRRRSSTEEQRRLCLLRCSCLCSLLPSSSLFLHFSSPKLNPSRIVHLYTFINYYHFIFRALFDRKIIIIIIIIKWDLYNLFRFICSLLAICICCIIIFSVIYYY